MERAMKFDLESVRKPIRIVRKVLQTLAKEPPVETIHRLRTNARRIEAILSATMPGEKKANRRLLKAIKPIRRAAGGVRDVDVLLRIARTLPIWPSDDSVPRLLAQLERLRLKRSHKLHRTVNKLRKKARCRLTTVSKLVETKLTKEGSHESSYMEVGSDAASRSAAKLMGWPALDEGNLHAFRIQVTELRYVLQADQAGDPNQVKALGKVKDLIGEWHDWRHLEEVAQKALDIQKDSAAIKTIVEMERKKLKKALGAANSLRTRSFGADLQSADEIVSRATSPSA
jgi:CHAD domain-containing protein